MVHGPVHYRGVWGFGQPSMEGKRKGAKPGKRGTSGFSDRWSRPHRSTIWTNQMGRAQSGSGGSGVAQIHSPPGACRSLIQQKTALKPRKIQRILDIARHGRRRGLLGCEDFHFLGLRIEANPLDRHRARSDANSPGCCMPRCSRSSAVGSGSSSG